jgi:predicted phage terminase large subunit-like protein
MNNIIKNLPEGMNLDIINQLLQDRKAMTVVGKENFLYFLLFYFGRYIELPLAQFHFEMLRIAQDEQIKRAIVMAFRNSGKSTILNTAYSLWSIMGKPQKKHIVIASQTQQRARDHLMNIRKEIENNKFLSENLGPFNIGEDRWGATTLIIPGYGARISAISIEEGIRGLKEGPYRPSLIIADDIEDSNSIKSQESRDKTFDWFTGELIPLGDTDVKIVVLGNFLHPDSVLSRLQKIIAQNKMDGVFLRIPIVGEKNNISWPGRFPTMESINKLKRGIGNEITWQRDFMLSSVEDYRRVVDPKWLRYYDKLPGPERRDHYAGSYTGIDLAISQKENADYTAMVSGKVYVFEDKIHIYILSDPINERLNFPETMERAKLISKQLGGGSMTTLIIEDNVYQRSAVDQLQTDGYPAEGFRSVGQDKRARIALTTDMIKSGQILFPKIGAGRLINQLTGFETEKHDDLADAFAILVLHIIKNVSTGPLLYIF